MEHNLTHTTLKRRLTESQITEIIADIRKLQQKH
jgi:hypothetical protein